MWNFYSLSFCHRKTTVCYTIVQKLVHCTERCNGNLKEEKKKSFSFQNHKANLVTFSVPHVENVVQEVRIWLELFGCGVSCWTAGISRSICSSRFLLLNFDNFFTWVKVFIEIVFVVYSCLKCRKFVENWFIDFTWFVFSITTHEDSFFNFFLSSSSTKFNWLFDLIFSFVYFVLVKVCVWPTTFHYKSTSVAAGLVLGMIVLCRKRVFGSSCFWMSMM